jgi:tetratricopeptide (TPR) repeat protein
MRSHKVTLFFIVCMVLLISFTAAYAQEKKDSDYWDNKGINYFNEGEYEKAIECFNTEFELMAIEANTDSEFIGPYLMRGNCYFELGKYDQALKDYTKLKELIPEDGDGSLCRAHVYYKIGQYDKALADVNDAVTLAPDAWANLCIRSNIYRELKRYEEAMADIERAISLVPTGSLVYFTRGKNYEAIGEKEKAFEDYKKACDIGKQGFEKKPANSKKKVQEFCGAYERLRKELEK